MIIHSLKAIVEVIAFFLSDIIQHGKDWDEEWIK